MTPGTANFKRLLNRDQQTDEHERDSVRDAQSPHKDRDERDHQQQFDDERFGENELVHVISLASSQGGCRF